MRRFRDPAGQPWEAVVGRESWGAFFAIFVPGASGEGVRQTQLEAATWADAERELDALDDDGLHRLLGRSTDKSLE
jgi:hypothetical protein